MIVISDTPPLISLMKIGHLDLLKSYFGEIKIPEAVYKELTSNSKFADEAKGRDVAEQMGIKIMDTIGLLIASYKNKHMNAEEIRKCIEILRHSGRHIGDKYFRLLMEQIQD